MSTPSTMHAARRLLLALAFAFASSAAFAAAPADFGAKADALLRRRAAGGEFSGVVLVEDHGRRLFRRAYGLANREWNAPVTPETVFRIGSTTKTFTAAAILMLRDDGKLTLQQPIGALLPDMPKAWTAITVRQLLNHSSGIPDYVRINGFVRGPGRLNLSPQELVALVRDAPLDFPPGSAFRYGNTDYVLLGLVIERLSGLSYSAFLKARIFAPLGLRATAYDDEADVVPNRAVGYAVDHGGAVNARLMTTASTFSAGGLRSTADDLARWSAALHGGRVLTPASTAEMFADAGHGYGLGSFVETRNGHRLWDHGGNLTGFSSAFEHYPDDGLTVIVLTNVEGTGSEHLAKDLAGLYFGWR